MRAWRIHGVGEPSEVLTLDELPDPVPAAGEVLVDVEAAGLNYADALLCRGDYQERHELPFIPGFEIAGRVSATVPGSRLPVGQRVAAMCALPRGGLAERVVVPDGAAQPIPDELSGAEACAMIITYLTGYSALHRRTQVRPGDYVLVHAGAGGVGSAAIQLATAAGARVLATAGGPEKIATCRRLGAELAVDYTTTDFVDAVREHTEGHGADIIVDPVGGDVFDRSAKVIAFEGRIIVVGFAGGRIATVSTHHPLVKNYSIVGVHWGYYLSRGGGDGAELAARYYQELVRLRWSGAIAPLISEILDFTKVPDGLSRIAHRGTIGKVLVQP